MKAVYTTKQMREEISCTDLITLNDEEYNEEMKKYIELNSRVIPEIKEQLIAIVNKYWYFFVKKVRNIRSWDQQILWKKRIP